MERYLLLSNGSAICICPPQAYVLSPSAEYTLIVSQLNQSTHLTRFVPNKHRRGVMRLVQFRNKYASKLPFVVDHVVHEEGGAKQSLEYNDWYASPLKDEWNLSSFNSKNDQSSMKICPSGRRLLYSTRVYFTPANIAQEDDKSMLLSKSLDFVYPITAAPDDILAIYRYLSMLHAESNKYYSIYQSSTLHTKPLEVHCQGARSVTESMEFFRYIYPEVLLLINNCSSIYNSYKDPFVTIPDVEFEVPDIYYPVFMNQKQYKRDYSAVLQEIELQIDMANDSPNFNGLFPIDLITNCKPKAEANPIKHQDTGSYTLQDVLCMDEPSKSQVDKNLDDCPLIYITHDACHIPLNSSSRRSRVVHGSVNKNSQKGPIISDQNVSYLFVYNAGENSSGTKLCPISPYVASNLPVSIESETHTAAEGADSVSSAARVSESWKNECENRDKTMDYRLSSSQDVEVWIQWDAKVDVNGNNTSQSGIGDNIAVISLVGSENDFVHVKICESNAVTHESVLHLSLFILNNASVDEKQEAPHDSDFDFYSLSPYDQSLIPHCPWLSPEAVKDDINSDTLAADSYHHLRGVVLRLMGMQKHISIQCQQYKLNRSHTISGSPSRKPTLSNYSMGLIPTVSVFASHPVNTSDVRATSREEVMSIALPVNSFRNSHRRELDSFLGYLLNVCMEISVKPVQNSYSTPTKHSIPNAGLGYISSLPSGMREQWIDSVAPGVSDKTQSYDPFSNTSNERCLQLINDATGTVFTQLSPNMVRGRFADRTLLNYNSDIQYVEGILPSGDEISISLHDCLNNATTGVPASRKSDCSTGHLSYARIIRDGYYQSNSNGKQGYFRSDAVQMEELSRPMSGLALGGKGPMIGLHGAVDGGIPAIFVKYVKQLVMFHKYAGMSIPQRQLYWETTLHCSRMAKLHQQQHIRRNIIENVKHITKLEQQKRREKNLDNHIHTSPVSVAAVSPDVSKVNSKSCMMYNSKASVAVVTPSIISNTANNGTSSAVHTGTATPLIPLKSKFAVVTPDSNEKISLKDAFGSSTQTRVLNSYNRRLLKERQMHDRIVNAKLFVRDALNNTQGFVNQLKELC